jgi:peptide deformylase
MVRRKSDLVIQYKNGNFEDKEIAVNGLTARVIQHEYDHIEGILFTDLISPLTKQLLEGKLKKISQGKVNVNYRMKFLKSK